MFAGFLRFLGKLLAKYLSKPLSCYKPAVTYSVQELASVLMPGDVVLVDGNSRFSVAIKYLTQSTWSHSAVFIGSYGQNNEPTLVEADVQKGVITVPLAKYEKFQIRICRPVRLTQEDCKIAVGYLLSKLGGTYDLKNVFDLARYLLPTPPVPNRWRRKLISFGSGEPTKAICSTLIAQAFQEVRYPILPQKDSGDITKENPEVFHIRNYTLFAPRDFDISPYFQILKPNLSPSFNYKNLNWGDTRA